MSPQKRPSDLHAELPKAEVILLFLFDVLGFSERVKEVGLAAIYAQYERLIELVGPGGPQLVLGAEPVDESGGMIPVTFVVSWQTAYFSDTFLLWTRLHTPGILDPAIHLARRVFCRSLANGLPLRGAMAVGEAVMDQQRGIYLGEPIIDAARAQAAQNCAGIGVARSWSDRRYFGGAIGRADGFLPYENHIKPGQEDHLCSMALDWPRTWRDSPEYAQVSLDDLIASYSRPGFETYWDATRRFVEHSHANPAWWENAEQTP